MFPYSCVLGIFLSRGSHSRWDISFSSVTGIVNHSEISLCRSNICDFTRHLPWKSGDTVGNLRFVQLGGGSICNSKADISGPGKPLDCSFYIPPPSLLLSCEVRSLGVVGLSQDLRLPSRLPPLTSICLQEGYRVN